MFKLLATGALFLGAEEGITSTTGARGSNKDKILFRKPRAQPAAGGPTFLTFTNYGDNATDCSAPQPFTRSAILVGLCATINSTTSADYQCPDTTACIASHYASDDCSGAPIETIKIPTSGDCERVQDPNSGLMITGKYTQSGDPTSTLGAPYMALFEDEDCSGDPVVLIDESLCETYPGRNTSRSTKCTDDGVLESCLWPFSATCTAGKGKGQCMTAPKAETQCSTLPQPVISYAKARQTFCAPPSPPRALLSSRARLKAAAAAAEEVPWRNLAGEP